MRVDKTMITINDVEDIELLQLFFEAFNVLPTEAEETISTEEIEEIVERKFKVMEEDFFKKLDARLNQHMIMIEESIASKYLKKSNGVKKEAVKPKSPVTVRKYRKKYKPFTLKGLNDDGTFIQARGKPLIYNIRDILALKKLIPMVDEYPSFSSLCKKVGLRDVRTVQRLCYLIETGKFDKYINQWEQMEANNFYGKYGEWKPRFENNPQKRKEKGMV